MIPAYSPTILNRQPTVFLIVVVLLLLGFTLTATNSFAASFDCRKASTIDEKLICDDPELSTLDSTLGELYSDLRGNLSPAANKKLKSAQRKWLKERHKCLYSTCLTTHYHVRIAELKQQQAASQYTRAGIEWEMLNQKALDLYENGHYDEAIISAKKALNVAEKNVGSNHPDVATSLDTLAELYRSQGDFANASPLDKRSLVIKKKVLGPDYPDLAKNRINLAFRSLTHKPEICENKEAYLFGLEIQDVIRNRDLKGLMKLFSGELENGPRRSFTKKKEFNDFFTEQWRKSILSKEPLCSPLGRYGFLFGEIHYDKIDYDKIDGNWQITQIYGAKKEKIDPSLPIGWKINGQILPPQCFQYIWMSGDNYEEYSRQFNISGDFYDSPGLSFGNEIPTFEPIVPEWSKNGETLPLATIVDQCLAKKYETSLSNGSVLGKDPSNRGGYSYKILARISPQQCKKLAPNITSICRHSYLLGMTHDGGGSMRIPDTYTIYGEFLLKNNKTVIVPLKNFDIKNEALNYIDSISKE